MTGPGRPTLGARLMGLAVADLADHDRLYGAVPWRGPGGSLLYELRASGLTGRGGASFPTWRKLATVLESARRGAVGPPVVIANAAESEPESAKDVTLLLRAPHLVLDGLQLAAEAVGAGEAVVYVKAGPGAQAMHRALSQRHATGRDRCPTRVHQAPATYLAGEASALAAAVAGGPARPHAHWLPLAERGIGGRPTLVDNVETLAHLATIARWGAGWFRGVGTVDDPGTLLVTVTGAVRVPGVVEVPFGGTLGELLALAGGASGPVGALRIGGYGGTWLPASAQAEGVFSRAGLAAWDASPGAGIVTVLPAHACGLSQTARIVAELAGQSAGQCGPCVTGLPRLAEATAAMARPGSPVGHTVVSAYTHDLGGTDSPGRASQPRPGSVSGRENPAAAASRALALAALVAGRGACHHPDGVARLVRSALRTFAADIRAHADGYCRGSAPA
ncbi:SLBB domain-containing protein [Frankia sp. R82]|uniref:SLBB domain-containing protein n=1 Tax=Frankia sp. R82 TaxID=2950553 RepID=UPI0035ABE34F